MSDLHNGIRFDQKSLKGVLKAIEKLPKELQKSAETAVLRSGARLILSAVRRNLSGSPVKTRTGTLKKSMGISIRAGKNGVNARIGSKNGIKSKYPKGVTGRRAKNKKGKPIYAEEVAWYMEQGTAKMPARPFIRPALDSTRDKVLSAMTTGLEKHLHRNALRLAKKAAR